MFELGKSCWYVLYGWEWDGVAPITEPLIAAAFLIQALMVPYKMFTVYKTAICRTHKYYHLLDTLSLISFRFILFLVLFTVKLFRAYSLRLLARPLRCSSWSDLLSARCCDVFGACLFCSHALCFVSPVSFWFVFGHTRAVVFANLLVGGRHLYFIFIIFSFIPAGMCTNLLLVAEPR